MESIKNQPPPLTKQSKANHKKFVHEKSESHKIISNSSWEFSPLKKHLGQCSWREIFEIQPPPEFGYSTIRTHKGPRV